MRCSGILMPISALPSAHGVGTFGREAYRFVDFLSAAGQAVWQVLPHGPTGFGDSPYQTFSAFAGNPYFIDLDLLCQNGYLLPEELAQDFGKDETRVDYGKLFENRFAVLAKAAARQNKAAPEYLAFCRENEWWLDDYAMYMAIKEAHGQAGFTKWPAPLRRREMYAMKTAEARWGPRIEFWRCVQFFFFRQWKALKNYANAQGVHIFGDIPLYVSPDSSDLWAHPELFQTHTDGNPSAVAGVPPDAFSDSGQLWGNPLYNWAYHRKTGYDWWIKRLRFASELFDYLRIDHFRGCESYWAVPCTHETAEHGEWVQGPGWEFVRAIHKALPGLKIIAEDLGCLTDEVYALLAYSGYPGMKVLQFAFGNEEENDYLPHNYPHNTVVYTGTHDNTTLRDWVKTAPKAETDFARRYLGVPRGGSLSGAILRAAVSSVADMAIIPLWDWLELPGAARFNTPSTLGGSNWRWRARRQDISRELAVKIRQETKLYGRLSPAEKEKEALAKERKEQMLQTQRQKEMRIKAGGKPVYTRRQMKQAEEKANAKGTSYEQLMENAGRAAAAEIEKLAPGPKEILLLCGRGNNAGDGFVIGRLLLEKGWKVQWVATGEGKAYSPLASKNLMRMGPNAKQVDMDAANWKADVIVDAVFGTGYRGQLPEGEKELFQKANAAGGLRVALDLPSGLDCDTGKAATGTFSADYTLTFGAYKPALLMDETKPYTGEVRCMEIGL